MSAKQLVVLLWLAYALLMIGITLVVLVWANKNKQFDHQDHASELPLEIEDDPIINKVK